jgi:threonine dehydratase
MQRTVDRQTIQATEELIRPYIRRTPVLEIAAADMGLQGAPVTLKLELTQHSGSFKARGAFANLKLRDIPAAGVTAASGGNHGAAVAYAAMTLGVPARIFVPEIASPAKIARIRGYGAELTVSGQRYGDALELCEAWQAQSGALSLHAYDDIETMLGQGTTALELEQQAPDLDTVLVAVGGGGLIGGVSSWYAGRTRIVGVEPEGAPSLYRARQAGRPVETPVEGVAADSLGPRQIGANTFPIAERFVERAMLVGDDDIRRAQQMLWDLCRIVVEPGGSAALAALTSGRYRPAADERVGVILCGANTTAVDFGR